MCLPVRGKEAKALLSGGTTLASAAIVSQTRAANRGPDLGTGR